MDSSYIKQKRIPYSSVAVLWIVSIYCCTWSINCATLLSFGPNHPQDVAAPGIIDDSNYKITSLVPLRFYGNTYVDLWLGSNGYIALLDTTAYYNSIPSPLNLTLIAPFFEDIKPHDVSGVIYYRQTTSDTTSLQIASNLVKSIFPTANSFIASYVLVVTWSEFTVGSESYLITFQAVVTSDPLATYAIFLYQDNSTGLTADIGIDAGDRVNYQKLCIGHTQASNYLPTWRQSCSSENGAFGFRIDSVNPDQGTYNCTETFHDEDCVGCVDLLGPEHGKVDTSSGTEVGDIATYSCTGGYDLHGQTTRTCLSNNSWSGPEPLCQRTASSVCEWGDTNHTFVNITFLLSLPGVKGIMAWDTEKYENGEDPSLSDARCKAQYTGEPTSLNFMVSLTTAAPDCGVRVTGTTVKLLEVTIRVYHDDERFQVVEDRVYQFNCSTDMLLPRVQELSQTFNDTEVTYVPAPSRSVILIVVSPYSDYVLSIVQMGQLIRLRVIYNNTANNIEPYGVYIQHCSAAGTIHFDSLVVPLIEDGCIVEKDPDATWYMSKAFQQTSLSAEGLFMADSGIMKAARVINKEKLFIRCLIGFCISDGTEPNLCTNKHYQHHTGQCKRTGGCYNELVVAFFSTGGGVKACDFNREKAVWIMIRWLCKKPADLDSCPVSGRKRRSDSEMNSQAVYASVTILDSQDGAKMYQVEDCVSISIVYIVFGGFGFLLLLSMILTCTLFYKLYYN